MSAIPEDINKSAKALCTVLDIHATAGAIYVIADALFRERQRCANIADQFSLDAEKQAALQEDPMVHDGMLMASDFCELLSDAIRNQTTKGIESGANAAADNSAPDTASNTTTRIIAANGGENV